MSKMGNLVLAMQEELEIIMDPTFVFHPSGIGLARFEIMAKTLSSQGFFCSAGDCETFSDQYQEYQEMSA